MIGKGVCVCVCVCMRVHTQSCPTLWDPMDCSLPGSFVHGIFQARILQWVAISSSTEPPGKPPKRKLQAQNGLTCAKAHDTKHGVLVIFHEDTLGRTDCASVDNVKAWRAKPF